VRKYDEALLDVLGLKRNYKSRILKNILKKNLSIKCRSYSAAYKFCAIEEDQP
jgi:hypothetical protein